MSSNLFSLHNHTAVVTGGSGGMAMAISRHLLEAGASLALMDNNMQRLQPAADELTQWLEEHQRTHGISDSDQIISAWACDVADADSVSSVVKAIRKHHGKPLNVLINTAGYCENIPALEYPADKVKRLIDVNLNGTLLVATEVARTLVADEAPGSMIFVASMSGLIINHPQPQTPYNMSKAGVIHLAKSLASEWATYKIRVNALSPGYIMTPLTRSILSKDPELKASWESGVPQARMADPEEFAGPIIFMASKASSYMTGHNLVVDGGYTIW